MAQRRMFSPDIVASDAFLEMPTSSRELYFQLGMYADDDGFVNPKKIVRLVGASEDDLKVLLAKRFVLPFESGVVVIKHWLIHNLIRKDRYKETRYIDEKKLLKVKENGAYTELATIRQPVDNQMAPQVRLGKVKIGKDTERESAASAPHPAVDFFENKERHEEIVQFLVTKGASQDAAREEVRKFVDYWTEPNKSGSKVRWQAERFFDIKRRLATWMRNAAKFTRAGQDKYKVGVVSG